VVIAKTKIEKPEPKPKAPEEKKVATI